MKFKTELHCHSHTVSDCADITARELVDKYVEGGYTTVVLMEHLNSATFAPGGRYNGTEDWQQKIDYYMEGYRALHAAAQGKLNILMGCELCVHDTHTDYLIHGVTESFLRENPDLMTLSKIKYVSKRVHEYGLLLYQAHPFRNGMNVTDPTLLDGIETYNGHPRHDSRNDFAAQWAQHYGLRRICGSDVHGKDDPASTAILTDSPITTREELLVTLREQNYTMLY